RRGEPIGADRANPLLMNDSHEGLRVRLIQVRQQMNVPEPEQAVAVAMMRHAMRACDREGVWRRQSTGVLPKRKYRDGCCRQLVEREKLGKQLRVAEAPMKIDHMSLSLRSGPDIGTLIADERPGIERRTPISNPLEHRRCLADLGRTDQQILVD